MADFETKVENGAAVPQNEADFGADFDIVAALNEEEDRRKEKWERDQAAKRAESGQIGAEEMPSGDEDLMRRGSGGGGGKRQRMEGGEGVKEEVFSSEEEWRKFIIKKYFVPSERVIDLYEEARLANKAADGIFRLFRKFDKIGDQQMQVLNLAIELQSGAEATWREARELDDIDRKEFPDAVGREMWMRDVLGGRLARLAREMEPLEGKPIQIPATNEAEVIAEAAPFLKPETDRNTRERKERDAVNKARRNILTYVYNLERQRRVPELDRETRATKDTPEYLRGLSKEIEALREAAKAEDPRKAVEEAFAGGLVSEDYSGIEKAVAAGFRKKMTPGVEEFLRTLSEKAEMGSVSPEDFERLSGVLSRALESSQPGDVLIDAVIEEDPARRISPTEYQGLSAILSGASGGEKKVQGKKGAARVWNPEPKVLKNPEAMALAAFIRSSDMPPEESARLLEIVENLLGDEKDFLSGLRSLVKAREVSKKDSERIKELLEKLSKEDQKGAEAES